MISHQYSRHPTSVRFSSSPLSRNDQSMLSFHCPNLSEFSHETQRVALSDELGRNFLDQRDVPAKFPRKFMTLSTFYELSSPICPRNIKIWRCRDHCRFCRDFKKKTLNSIQNPFPSLGMREGVGLFASHSSSISPVHPAACGESRWPPPTFWGPSMATAVVASIPAFWIVTARFRHYHRHNRHSHRTLSSRSQFAFGSSWSSSIWCRRHSHLDIVAMECGCWSPRCCS